MPVSPPNDSNPSQETSHTGDPNHVWRNESTHLQDRARRSTSSTLDSVASGGRPVAVAIDFLGDGTTAVHRTYTYPPSPDAPPSFQCALQPNSIRVILFETHEVFLGPDWLEPPRECCCFMYPNQDSRMCNVCTFRTVGYQPRASSTESLSDSAPQEHSTTSKEPSISDTGSPFTKKTKQPRGPYGAAASSTFSGASRSSCSTCQARRRSQRWKTYRSASGLNQIDLHGFWSHGGGLELGTNVILDNVSTAEARTWNKVASLDGHVLFLGGAMYPVYTLPSCMRIHRRNGNALEVECRFLHIEMERNSETYDIRSGLRDTFWDLLNALASAPRLFNNDLQLGTLLVTLELLAAQQFELCYFLNTVRRNLPWRSEEFNAKSSNAYLSDKQHISDYARFARDLVQATDCTISAIRRMSCSDKRLKAKFEEIIAQKRAMQVDLGKFVKDVKQDAESMFYAAEQCVSQRRDATLKRLTFVASLFLPLTLASSILSMNNRVKELGPLWWDWLGICVITGLVVISGYHVSSSWDNIKNLLRADAFKQWPRGLYWNRAKKEILHKASRHGTRRTSLLPRAVRIAWLLGKTGLYLAICASFLLGMFGKNVGEGGRVLGYSIAGAIVFFFTFVLFWKLVKAVIRRGSSLSLSLACSRRRRSRSRGGGSGQQRRDNSAGGASAMTSSTTRTTTKKSEDEMYKPPLKEQLWLKAGIYFGGLILAYDTWDETHSWVRAGSVIWFGVHGLKLMAFFFDDLIIKTMIRFLWTSSSEQRSRDDDFVEKTGVEMIKNMWPKHPEAMAKRIGDLERQPPPRASTSRISLDSLGDVHPTTAATTRRASVS